MNLVFFTGTSSKVRILLVALLGEVQGRLTKGAPDLWICSHQQQHSHQVRATIGRSGMNWVYHFCVRAHGDGQRTGDALETVGLQETL